MLEDVLKKWGGKEVSAMEVYTNIFKLGEGCIQKYNAESENLKANPLGYYKSDNKDSGHYRIFFEDTFEETLHELQEADFAIVNGLSYFGRRNMQEYASKMYAMIFDLDGQTDTTLNNFLSGAFSKHWNIYPLPNYIILSGHGIHLYYVFDVPVPLYPNIKLQLKNLKYALTEKMWNPYTSEIKKQQFQGINQGFRVIGGKTKIEGVRVKAFEMNTHPFSLLQLCEYVGEQYKIDESKLYKESKLSLAQAKKKYPEWYEKRVIQKDRTAKKWDIQGKVHGKNPLALYDWWKKKMEVGATFHHRYFCIMCLVIYGVKASVPYEQIKQDAYNYIEFMNLIAPDNEFTKADVDSALECYDERYCTFPINDISKLASIEIIKNKRNGRKQVEHLENIRAIRDLEMKRKGKRWTDRNGRPSKQAIIEQWQQSHPEGKKAECIRDTGLSKPTVYKFWKTE